MENKERIQKFKETEDSRYTYQKILDKACFQHAMVMDILRIFLEELPLIKNT